MFHTDLLLQQKRKCELCTLHYKITRQLACLCIQSNMSATVYLRWVIVIPNAHVYSFNEI